MMLGDINLNKCFIIPKFPVRQQIKNDRLFKNLLAQCTYGDSSS